MVWLPFFFFPLSFPIPSSLPIPRPLWRKADAECCGAVHLLTAVVTVQAHSDPGSSHYKEHLQPLCEKPSILPCLEQTFADSTAGRSKFSSSGGSVGFNLRYKALNTHFLCGSVAEEHRVLAAGLQHRCMGMCQRAPEGGNRLVPAQQLSGGRLCFQPSVCHCSNRSEQGRKNGLYLS